MKLNTVLLILFLILSIKANSPFDSYSIDPFKNDLKRNGLFEIILSIKKTYGKDIAIISCEELNENCKGNCKRLVTEYMDSSDTHKFSKPTTQIGTENKSRQIIRLKPAEEHIECINKLYYSLIINTPYPKLDLERNLRRKFTENQSKLMYNKIKKRIRDLGLCKK